MDTFNIISLIIGILGIIGGATIAKYLNKAKDNFFRKSLSSVFNLVNRQILIVGPSQFNPTSRPYVLTTYEDSIALSIAQIGFLDYGIKADVLLHSNVSENYLANNLFLICGPGGNSITKLVLSRVNPAFNFTQTENGWIITDAKKEQLHSPPTTNKDYGLIIKVNNPWSQNKPNTKIYVCAGIGGTGTWGSTLILIRDLRLLYKRLKEKNINPSTDNFCVLVEAEKGEIEQPQTDILKVTKF